MLVCTLQNLAGITMLSGYFLPSLSLVQGLAFLVSSDLLSR